MKDYHSNSSFLRIFLFLVMLGISVAALESWRQISPVCFNSVDAWGSRRGCMAFANKPACSCLIRKQFSILYQHPPPGSGYLGAADEKSYLPDTYEPTMEYPGTLRPGRTRENISFQDLPIGDDDPDPVPWPHFQEIDFYHVWPAPHPNPKPINDIIAECGRWATPEEEAEMMRDARRGVRLMKEMQEAEKKAFVLVDDDDDDPLEQVEVMDAVLDGDLQGQIQGKPAITKLLGKKQQGSDSIITGDDEAIDFSELNFDDGEDAEDEDFLLELGLDEEEGAEDIIMSGNAKVEESELVDDSTEEVASDDADVLDDIVGTDVLDDITDAESVLGLNNFDDEEDDYYVGENDEDFGDLDAYDDNEGIY
eukprot:CAMPEP_0172415248 /NCGR_PEP_ID=MMETSP1064-20121228/1704_1 /TAXON_ID=202472 /ORGANISM="Aulacoseira subarctica , Strain CCAP 1002/5" /LENGTH=365 /DNA_ID=CAMNT_0013152173 /DNA_START=36 /DNA_END=1133 /DNA_ORIENTATION=-